MGLWVCPVELCASWYVIVPLKRGACLRFANFAADWQALDSHLCECIWCSCTPVQVITMVSSAAQRSLLLRLAILHQQGTYYVSSWGLTMNDITVSWRAGFPLLSRSAYGFQEHETLTACSFKGVVINVSTGAACMHFSTFQV